MMDCCAARQGWTTGTPEAVFCFALLAASLLIAGAAYAEEPASPDCEPHTVHADVEGPLLTREEKIALLDRAFQDSLARFEQCRQATSASAGQGGGNGGGGNSAGGNGSDGNDAGGTGESGESMESVAASGVRGTEPGMPKDGTTTANVTHPSEPSAPSASAPPHGAIPKDIPSPDNDSVLEAQIRRAAMEETDPERKAMLWDEYRRYKGLPATDRS